MYDCLADVVVAQFVVAGPVAHEVRELQVLVQEVGGGGEEIDGEILQVVAQVQLIHRVHTVTVHPLHVAETNNMVF